MAYEDWLMRYSAPIATAVAATPNLPEADARKLTGLAWIAAKHKELISMSDEDSQKAFDRLERKKQNALLEVFGNQAYSPEDLGFFGSLKNYAGKALGGVGDVLTGYGEVLGQPARALIIKDDYESFADAWAAAEDGNRLFDADREEVLRKTYGDTVSNIVKKMASGKTLGDIIMAATTDEQFAVIEKMLQGDQNIRNAMRDFNDAKVSPGRWLAQQLYLNPEVGKTDQGVMGTAYKLVSGTADLAYSLLADPTTYLAGPVAAVNKGRFAIAEIMRAEAVIQHGVGELTAAQKAAKLLGKNVGIDGAFENKNVRKLFDTVGTHVKTLSEATDKTKVAQARIAIQDTHRVFDDNFIDEMLRGKVFDADSAKKHFKSIDALQNVVMGRVGTDSLVLPTRGHMLYTRKRMSELTRKVSGYDKSKATMDKFIASGAIDNIAAAKSPADAKQFNDLRNTRQRIARWFDRALVDNAIITGGTINGVNGRNRSAGTVYTLARAVFDKPTARLLSQMFVSAPSEAEARNIIKGIYMTLGDATGATATTAGKRDMKNLIANMTSAQFTEKRAVYGKIAKLHGVPDGTLIDSSLVKGADGEMQSLANATYQLSHTLHVPQLLDVFAIKNKYANDYRTFMTKPRSIAQVTTDWWSAMNLLPRLGLRSVLDEALFNYLTVPVNVARHSIRGAQASYTERMLLGKPDFKDVGVVARHILRPIMLKNVSKEDVAKAMKDEDFAAKLFEKQLTTSILGRVTFAGEKGQRFAQYLSDIVEHGGHDQIRALSEGTNKMVSTFAVTNKEFIGKVTDISEDLRKAARQHGVEFSGHPTIYVKPAIDNETSVAFRMNAWAQMINRVDRNGPIGQLAMRHIDDPEKAVREIAKRLRANNGELYKRFDSATFVNDPDKDAVRFFTHVYNVFADDAGNLNTRLIDKMRQADGSFTAANLTLDDIDEIADMLPREIFGYANSIEVYETFGNFMNELVETGFRIADRQVSTLSRTPAAYMYSMSFREKFSNVEEAFVRKFMKANPEMPEAHVRKIAARKYSTLSTDLALNRVLGFIDNPHVRSNAAFSARNVARYYRANEDFYRRAMRAASPEAVIRMRLASDALDNAGFIHEDENGDKYFTIPADEILYNAYALTFGRLAGVENIRRPMPMALTGKVKMLTPSLDPESNLPTFASPFMSIAWSAVLKVVPQELFLGGSRDAVTKTLFGKYATNANIWDQVTPSAIKRVFNGLNVLGVGEEQIASAAMQAGRFYAAIGRVPGENATQDELDQFKYDVQVTARNIVFIRNMVGLLSPVSPQLSEINDIPDYLLDSDVAPLKREFTKMVSKAVDAGETDAWNVALKKFTKVNPGMLVYTVSETTRDTSAPIRYTKQTADWMKANSSMTSRYRGAAAFLAPQVNKSDMESYAFLKREGYIQDKSVDTYIDDIRKITLTNEYYATRDEYETKIANAQSPDHAARLRFEADQALAQYRKQHPQIDAIMEKQNGTTMLKKDVVTSMRNLLASGEAPESRSTRIIREMLRVYDVADRGVNAVTASTDAAGRVKDTTRGYAHERLQKLADRDVNAALFYDTILKSLIG